MRKRAVAVVIALAAFWTADRLVLWISDLSDAVEAVTLTALSTVPPPIVGDGMDLLIVCGPPSGEGAAIVMLFLLGPPLAVLGLTAAGTKVIPPRGPIASLTYGALVLQHAATIAGTPIVLALLADVFVFPQTGVETLLFVAPLLLHVALNAAGLVAWRHVDLRVPVVGRPLLRI